ncbi:hypothetical protein ACTXN7_11670 [Corynebacterium flavescens]|uniref:hypothetical protein n=1 Tax=Corynebacterium flavescens TaxID=28028 RepID=UPI003FD6043B
MGRSASLSVGARQKARQKARSVIAAKRAELEEREKSFEEVFAGVLAREELDEKIGHGLNALHHLGVTKAEIANDTGLSATEISRLLKLGRAEEDEESDDGDVSEASDTADVSAPAEGAEDAESSGHSGDASDAREHDGHEQ